MILLDTHVVIWLLVSPKELSAPAREIILKARLAGERLSCSAVSLYEIAYAVHRKRLKLDVTIEEFIAAVESRIETIPLTAKIAICATQLPQPFHGDPMDRIIAATAIVEDCALITHDDRILKSNVCKALG